jgi:hypothetical protein
MRAQFVFEKFSDASDPIKDMKIGIDKKIYSIDYAWTRNWDNQEFDRTFVGTKAKIKEFIEMRKKDRQYRIYDTLETAKLVKENLHEKFNDESDPITDMGIGTGNIDNLRLGSILRAKHEFEVMDTNGGNKLIKIFIPNMGFGASHDYQAIDKKQYIIVLKAEYDENLATVYYVKTSDKLKDVKVVLYTIKRLHTETNMKANQTNFFRTDRKNMNKYFEFITFDE